MEGAEVPASWSQLASDILMSKYFRKAGLHGDKDKGERSIRQVVHRLAHTIRTVGESYFANKAEADAFEAELSYLLVNQYGAFNSPVWFNLGLFHEYGISGQGGNWAWGGEDVAETSNAYERPQCSACFIQAAKDDLMSIYDLVKAEARLFKYGSGTGTNFSAIRGRQEKLSGGGTSSGLMSFLEVFDRAAGATKSGGTTRRAAKMVCLDMDHPEIADFIGWKEREEKKAHALIAAGYSSDFNGDAYHTISGQNSNNSVRVTDDFMRAVEAGGKWQTRFRTDRRGLCRDARARRATCGKQGRPGGVGLRRPRRAVRLDDQPLAHLPEHGAHQRVEPVLRVHVPRRHGLQPGEREPHQVPARGRVVRRRRLPARVPHLLHRAGDPRRPVRATRRRASRATVTTTAPRPLATRTSAAC